jgi:hypothetical protein
MHACMCIIIDNFILMLSYMHMNFFNVRRFMATRICVCVCMCAYIGRLIGCGRFEFGLMSDDDDDDFKEFFRPIWVIGLSACLLTSDGSTVVIIFKNGERVLLTRFAFRQRT